MGEVRDDTADYWLYNYKHVAGRNASEGDVAFVIFATVALVEKHSDFNAFIDAGMRAY